MFNLVLSIDQTRHDGAVAMSSANGLVGTGFVFRYRPQTRVGF